MRVRGWGDGPDEMRIRDVSVRRPARVQAAENRTARLDLTLLDEHGAPTAARVGIFDVGSGREVLASADAVPILRYLELVRDIAADLRKLLAQHAARLAARLPRGRPMRLLSAAARLVRELPGRKTSWPAPSLAAAGRRLVARARPPAARSRLASHQSLDGLRERTLWRTCFAGRLRGHSHAWSWSIATSNDGWRLPGPTLQTSSCVSNGGAIFPRRAGGRGMHISTSPAAMVATRQRSPSRERRTSTSQTCLRWAISAHSTSRSPTTGHVVARAGTITTW